MTVFGPSRRPGATVPGARPGPGPGPADGPPCLAALLTAAYPGTEAGPRRPGPADAGVGPAWEPRPAGPGQLDALPRRRRRTHTAAGPGLSRAGQDPLSAAAAARRWARPAQRRHGRHAQPSEAPRRGAVRGKPGARLGRAPTARVYDMITTEQ